ncbi:hypothetical protein RHMOL_Rhmol13G0266300 [Rhododendron molle]|uniref:Uncharacterized protein n=1 Tax=Rhododendron molle TaxID=49168 RepID=A0ACC0LCL4_RHOML|nr:hypothetical protein RHMOL_Rhmol13G0266300 [Rhododendron molle]
MISYSSWNGVKMHANRDLVTGFLKDKLKFRGFVISDWQGLDRITSPPHANYSYSVQAGVLAGIDMIMVPMDFTEFIDDLTLQGLKRFTFLTGVSSSPPSLLQPYSSSSLSPMGKREKNPKAAKSHHEEEEEEEEEEDQEHQQLNPTRSPIVVSSDDEEANEDLSLRIVEKAMLRACTAPQSFTFDVSSSSSQETEVVASDSKSTKKKSRKEKNKKSKKVEKQEEETVVVAMEEEKAETSKAAKSNELAETNPADIPDNVVLRKLLRGPRYFDPPDSGWGACYNCGEEGHITVNCTLAKRTKPCFVCGSLEHHAKQCTKVQYERKTKKKNLGLSKAMPIARSICFKQVTDLNQGRDEIDHVTLDQYTSWQACLQLSFLHQECVLLCSHFLSIEICNPPPKLYTEIWWRFPCGKVGHVLIVRSPWKVFVFSHKKVEGQDCFICKKGGHRAKDCPEKYKRVSQSSKICLKCGDSGHEMFSCKNNYAHDDLKEIQCYICESFGHLCCADFADNGPGELSCYRCGQLGHTGLISESSVWGGDTLEARQVKSSEKAATSH